MLDEIKELQEHILLEKIERNLVYALKEYYPEAQLVEVAPEGMEDWVRKNKRKFQLRYGSHWEKYLYGVAWNLAKKK